MHSRSRVANLFKSLKLDIVMQRIYPLIFAKCRFARAHVRYVSGFVTAISAVSVILISQVLIISWREALCNDIESILSAGSTTLVHITTLSDKLSSTRNLFRAKREFRLIAATLFANAYHIRYSFVLFSNQHMLLVFISVM